MKSGLFFLLFTSMLPMPLLGQHHLPLLTIQHIELQDSVVVREIKKLIAEETDSIELVRKGMGYVSLYIREYHDNKSPFLRDYGFSIIFSFPHSDWLELSYPLFYTYLSGRLVLIYVDGLQHSVRLAYSTKSKKQLSKLIAPFVDKPQKLVFRDLAGNKVFTDKHARHEPIRFDSGKVVYIKKDGSVIVRMANDFRPVD